MLSNAVLRNFMPANYRHSQTQLTPLMVVAGDEHHSVADTLEKHQLENSESLLRINKDRYDEEVVYVDLASDLLHMIDQPSSEGAVLIFLPGYEEIMNIIDRILYNDSRFASSRKFEVCCSHPCLH